MASEKPLLNLDSPIRENVDDFVRLKKDLEGYRELLLPLKKIIEWEQNYYPAIIVGVITLVFALIWYIEPSVLTGVCMVGIIACVVDFTIPALTGVLFSSSDWNDAKEQQYDSICKRLLHAKQHFVSVKNYMATTKEEKPKLYVAALLGAFVVLAWLGSTIDNLFLTYLIVIGLALTPGVRKSGLVEKLSKQATDKISGLKDKAKTN